MVDSSFLSTIYAPGIVRSLFPNLSSMMDERVGLIVFAKLVNQKYAFGSLILLKISKKSCTIPDTILF